MDIIRYIEVRAIPGRNDGGQTRELVSFPVGTADFDWRISIVDVTVAGEFSVYPGVERIFALVEGELLVLIVDGVEHPMEQYRQFRFAGDSVTNATLPVGATTGLNVMARRGKFKAYISIIELSKKRSQPVFGDQLATLLQGNATVSVPASHAAGAGQGEVDVVDLHKFDTVRGQDPAPEILGRGFLAVITLEAESS